MRSDNITKTPETRPNQCIQSSGQYGEKGPGQDMRMLVMWVTASLVLGAGRAEACQVPWLVLMYQLACGRASVTSRQGFKIKLLFMQLTSWERKPK